MRLKKVPSSYFCLREIQKFDTDALNKPFKEPTEHEIINPAG